MFSRSVQIYLGPNSKDPADEVARNIAKALQRQPNYEGLSYYADYDSGNYVFMTNWTTQASAEHALDSMMREVSIGISGMAMFEPRINVYEKFAFEPAVT